MTEAARRDSATTRRDGETTDTVLALKLMHADQRVADLEQELGDATADLADARAAAAADAEAQGKAYEKRFSERGARAPPPRVGPRPGDARRRRYVEDQRKTVLKIRTECEKKLEAAARRASWDPFEFITCSMEADDGSYSVLDGSPPGRSAPARDAPDDDAEPASPPHEPLVNLVI